MIRPSDSPRPSRGGADNPLSRRDPQALPRLVSDKPVRAAGLPHGASTTMTLHCNHSTTDAHLPASLRSEKLSPLAARSMRRRIGALANIHNPDPGGARRGRGHLPSRAQASRRNRLAALLLAASLFGASGAGASPVSDDSYRPSEASPVTIERLPPPPSCLPSTAASVTPCGTGVTTKQSVTRSVVFRVTHTGSSGDEYSFACSVTAPISSCTPSLGSDLLSSNGSYVDVTVSYATGSSRGAGEVRLTATSLTDFGSAYGFYGVMVDDSTRLAPDLQAGNNDGVLRDLARCVAACFEATAAVGTPAYISLDAPRAVSLVYVGRQAQQFATLHVDATEYSSNPADTMKLEVLNASGSPITLENGTTELFFRSGAGKNRLAARFSTTGLGTGAHRYIARVTSAWNGNALKRTTTLPVTVLVINESASPYGYGWSVAGVPRIHANTSGDTLVMTDGAGSIALYQPGNCVPACEYTNPWRDFSILSRTGITDSGIRWERRFLDGGKVSFDSTGRAKYVTDRFGNRATFFWLDASRLDSIQDPIGKSVRFAYDGSSKLRAVRDPGGRITQFSVNASGDLLFVKDSATATLVDSFYYDASHRLVDRFDAARSKYTFVYDHVGLVATDSMPIVLANGDSVRPAIRFRTLDSVRVLSVASGLGSRSNPGARIDPDTLQLRITDPEGNVSKLLLDALTQPTRVIGPVGDTTRFNRFAGRLHGITYPWGASDSFEYDSQGRLLWAKPASGDTLYLRYGTNSQPDSIWGPQRATVRNFLGTAGRVDSTRVAGLYTTRYTHDSRGRVTQVKDHENHTSKFFFHAGTGNLDSTHAEGNRWTKMTFDAYGRTESALAKGMSRVWTQYDGFNRVTRTWTEGHSPADTIKFYHGLIFTDSIIDGKNQKYRWTYNRLGWTLQEFDPDVSRGFMSYAYDSNGQVKTWTNRRGGVMNFAYDSAGRLRARWETGGAQPDSFSYSADSRRVVGWNGVSRDSIFRASDLWTDSVATRFAVDASRRFAIRYTKDRLGRIDSVQALNPGGAIQFATRKYAYDVTTGRLASVRIAGKLVRFKYDSEGLRDSVLFDSVGVKRWTKYTSNHQPYLVDFSPSGHSDAFQRRYGLDSLYRIDEIGLKDVASGDWDIERFRYDGKGQLSGRQTTVTTSHCDTFTAAYGYDCQSPASLAITRDAVGNTLEDNIGDLLTTSYKFSYDTGNRVLERAHQRLLNPSQWDTLRFTHDLDGNRDSLKSYTGAITAYAWSADGKLLSVSRGTTTLAYGYNAFGQLAQRKRNGSAERHLLWDGDNLFAELNGGVSGRIGEYVYQGIDAPLALVTGDSSMAKVRFFEQDQVGNVVGLFRSTVDQTYEYSYRGTLEDSTGAVADTNRARWKGSFFEGDIAQLYYMRNRWYDPASGRFLSADPIGLAGEVSIYGYGDGDPVTLRDPWGLQPEDDCEKPKDKPKTEPQSNPIMTSLHGSADEEECDDPPTESGPSATNKGPRPGNVGIAGVYGTGGPIGRRVRRAVEKAIEKYEPIAACTAANQFSTLFEGTGLQGAVAFVEVAAPTSLLSDLVAYRKKITELPRLARSTGVPYASGLNRLFRTKLFRDGADKVRPGLIAFGNKATPILAVAGAGTLAYNSTIMVQCALGVIE